MSDLLSSAPAILPHSRVAILGLGLMGGSLAYALSGKCAALIGVDPDAQTLRLAETSGIFQELHARPEAITTPVDVWILAAPVRSILAILAEMSHWQGRGGIVLDLGSTKVHITQAMRRLPDAFDPLGGHPMCGKEKGSFAHAEAGLFRDANFAFCRLENSSTQAMQFAEELATAIGAASLWIDAETHDRWTAATSHLPYLIANALAAATPREVAPLIGPGFRSSTRVAGSDPGMMLDILLTNRAQILVAAASFQDAFLKLLVLLEADGEGELAQKLQSGRLQRDELFNLQELV